MDVLLGLTPDGAADAEESERLTIRLRAEVRRLDIYTLQVLADGAPPEGAKAVDPVTAGAVVLALSAPSGGTHFAGRAVAGLARAAVRRAPGLGHHRQ